MDELYFKLEPLFLEKGITEEKYYELFYEYFEMLSANRNDKPKELVDCVINKEIQKIIRNEII